MTYQSLFAGKIKKNINLFSAEFAKRVVKVKYLESAGRTPKYSLMELLI